MWQKKANSLYKKFEFKDFDEAFSFIEKVAGIAKNLNHHPKIVNDYNIVELWLTSHSAGNVVTEKNELLAKKIDSIETLPPSSSESKPKLPDAKLYADGGSRGNPGPSALGYVIYDMNDNLIEKNSRYIGISTNNRAEYLAVWEGLEALKILDVKRLNVFLDSLLVVNQLNGLYKIKNRDLQPLHQAVTQLLSSFDSFTLTHVPREKNAVADGMVNECLDEQEKK